MDLNNKLLRNAEASFKSHLDGGECDHLVAYSMACTIENEDEHELKHQVIRFGSLDEVLMMMIEALSLNARRQNNLMWRWKQTKDRK